MSKHKTVLTHSEVMAAGFYFRDHALEIARGEITLADATAALADATGRTLHADRVRLLAKNAGLEFPTPRRSKSRELEALQDLAAQIRGELHQVRRDLRTVARQLEPLALTGIGGCTELFGELLHRLDEEILQHLESGDPLISAEGGGPCS